MTRAALFAATALGLAAVAPAHAFPGFGKKPAPAASSQAAAPDKPEPPATAAQRAAADRLDPLARAAFWGHEVQREPKDAGAEVSFAAALRTLGRYDEARQAADQALVLDPKNAPALLEAARAAISAKQGFYALDYLKRAQALSPRDWRPVSLQGVALDQIERVDEARAAFARALTLSPDNPAVLSNLALSYAARGEVARAEPLMRRAASLPSASVQERQNLALLLGLQGRYAEAEALMRQDLPPEQAANNLDYVRTLAARSAARTWPGAQAGAPAGR